MDLNPIDQETQQSASAAQLKAGFAALRFQGPLEKEFQEAYLEQVLPRGRISGLVALVLLLTLICIDFLVGDAASLETNTIRLGILVPILVLMLIAMHLPALKNHYTVVVAVGVTIRAGSRVQLHSISTAGGLLPAGGHGAGRGLCLSVSRPFL